MSVTTIHLQKLGADRLIEILGENVSLAARHNRLTRAATAVIDAWSEARDDRGVFLTALRKVLQDDAIVSEWATDLGKPILLIDQDDPAANGVYVRAVAVRGEIGAVDKVVREKTMRLRPKRKRARR